MKNLVPITTKYLINVFKDKMFIDNLKKIREHEVGEACFVVDQLFFERSYGLRLNIQVTREWAELN